MCLNASIPFNLVAKMCNDDCTLECFACDVYPNCSSFIRITFDYRSLKDLISL